MTREQLLKTKLSSKAIDAGEWGDVDYNVFETRKAQVPLEVMETEDEELIKDWIYENVDTEIEELGSYNW